jgi:hypothetical protein
VNRRNRYLASRAALGVGLVLFMAGIAVVIMSGPWHRDASAVIVGVVMLVAGFALMLGGFRADPREPWEKAAHTGITATDALDEVDKQQTLQGSGSRYELDRERAERDRPPEDW